MLEPSRLSRLGDFWKVLAVPSCFSQTLPRREDSNLINRVSIFEVTQPI